MTEDEFKKKMKELGWTDEEINKRIKIRHESLEKNGFAVPLEAMLHPTPILNSSLPVGKHLEIY